MSVWKENQERFHSKSTYHMWVTVLSSAFLEHEAAVNVSRTTVHKIY
ncbi:MAG TPA: hypothetical protein VN258_10870 [Mobilitalea sp.]|nr:hypothetical protein [Mobilitalea sp.]